MRRLLQAVSAILAVLACAIGWRMVQVISVRPPTFEDPPQVALRDALPPVPQSPAPRGAAVNAILEGNLFEPERGAVDVPGGADAAAGDEPPLPPPTNVVLNGVFVMRGQPMAIVTDSNSGNKQLTLHVGDNVGDYQVGDITESRVTLLGRGGQQFSLDLEIKKGPAGGKAVAPRTPPRPATPARAQPPGRSQTAAQRAAAQRAANQAQTPAQRAAAARAAAARRNAVQQAGANAAGRAPAAATPQQRQINAAQARLDALKRLREAQQN